MKLFVWVVLSSVVLSCGRESFSGTGDVIPVTKLLRRSSTAKWETKRATATGVQVDVPTDLCGFLDDAALGAVIRLHTLPPPPGVLDDKRCLLEMKIERMKKDVFERERASDSLKTATNDPNAAYWTWNLHRHNAISRFDDPKYAYYRYDLDCPAGDVVWTRTSVMKVYEGGVSLYDQEDDAIVRRILGALRCIERQH